MPAVTLLRQSLPRTRNEIHSQQIRRLPTLLHPLLCTHFFSWKVSRPLAETSSRILLRVFNSFVRDSRQLLLGSLAYITWKEVAASPEVWCVHLWRPELCCCFPGKMLREHPKHVAPILYLWIVMGLKKKLRKFFRGVCIFRIFLKNSSSAPDRAWGQG